MRIVYIFLFVAGLVSARAEDVGVYFIRSKETVGVSCDSKKNIIIVEDRILFTRNLYFESELKTGEMLVDSIRVPVIRLDSEGGVIHGPIQLPEVRASIGKCVNIIDSNNGSFLITLELGHELPLRLELSVCYQLKLPQGPKNMVLMFSPYFETLEFMPPILFKLGLHRLEVMNFPGWKIMSVMGAKMNRSDNGTNIIIAGPDDVKVKFMRLMSGNASD